MPILLKVSQFKRFTSHSSFFSEEFLPGSSEECTSGEYPFQYDHPLGVGYIAQRFSLGNAVTVNKRR